MRTFAAALFSLFLFAGADGWLGVYLDPERTAPTVIEVVPGSPAASAGLAAGDVILTVDDKAVATRDELVAAVRACAAGQRVRLRVERAGKEVQLVVQLAERPAETGQPPAGTVEIEPRKPAAPAAPAGGEAQAPAAARGFLGAGIREAGGALVITRVLPDSPAARAHLAADDEIVRFGDRAVSALAELDACMKATKAGDRVRLHLRRDGKELDVEVELGSQRADAARGERADVVPEPAAPRGFGTDFAAAQQQAQQQQRPLLVLYGAAWDGSSQAQRRAFADAALAPVLAGYVCVYVDAEQNRELLAQRRIAELPSIEVVGPGERHQRLTGFVPVEVLRGKLASPAAAVEPKQPPAHASEPAPSDADLRAEVERLRRELDELRRTLDELRKARGGGGRE